MPLNYLYIKPYARTIHLQSCVFYKHSFVFSARVGMYLQCVLTWVGRLQAPEDTNTICLVLMYMYECIYMDETPASICGLGIPLCVTARMHG